MQESFPRKARQGPYCPGCGGETLLSSRNPDTFECLDCGKIVEPRENNMQFEDGEELAPRPE